MIKGDKSEVQNGKNVSTTGWSWLRYYDVRDLDLTVDLDVTHYIITELVKGVFEGSDEGFCNECRGKYDVV